MAKKPGARPPAPAARRKPGVARPAIKPAARTARRASAPARKPRAAMPFRQQLFLTGFCVVLLAAALPTALMLSLALLPAVCAFVVDRTPGRYAAISVGALNLAGTWPFLLMLWTGGHTVMNAMTIILNPFAWLIIYSAAAVGWLLYLSFPSFVSVCMSVFAGHRVTQLRQQQKKLIEEWGPEVASHHTAPHR
jgi:hypothetical protein